MNQDNVCLQPRPGNYVFPHHPRVPLPRVQRFTKLRAGADTYRVQDCDPGWLGKKVHLLRKLTTWNSAALRAAPPPDLKAASGSPPGRPSRRPRCGSTLGTCPAPPRAARVGAERGLPQPSFPSPLPRPRGGAVKPGRPDSSAALPAPGTQARPAAAKPDANSSCAKPNLPAGKRRLSSHLSTPSTSHLLIGSSGSANRLRPFWF